MPGKKIFFAADFHLTYQAPEAMRNQENKIISWLESIQPTTHALLLLGDIFDFWFEYKHVIPKGFIRFQNKLASFTDQGIPVYFAPGNHDQWIKDYFTQELGITILSRTTTLCVADLKICTSHGDDLGVSLGYHFMKKHMVSYPFFYWLARQLPPDLLFGTALRRADARRKDRPPVPKTVINDWMVECCKTAIQPYTSHDYYVFGHLHFPYSQQIAPNSIYFNVGDWINHFSYLICDAAGCRLAQFLT